MPLEYQISAGHTSGYDRDAGNPDWIGLDILRDVENSPNKNTLEIKLEEFIPRVSIQKPKTNPFELTSLKAISGTVRRNQPM